MDSHDDMGIFNSSEATAASTNSQQPMSEERQNSGDTIASPTGHAPQDGTKQESDVAAQQQQPIKGEFQDHIEQLKIAVEEPGKQPQLLQQDTSSLPDSQNHSAAQALQQTEGNPETREVEVSADHADSSIHAEANIATTNAFIQEPEANEIEPVPTSATPESLRGNPYRLSGSLVATEHGHEGNKLDVETSEVSEVRQQEATGNPMQEAAMDAHEVTEFSQDHEDGSSVEENVSDSESLLGDTYDRPTSKQRPHSKENEGESSDEPSCDEHDCGDGEGDDGDGKQNDEDLRQLATRIRADVAARSELTRRQGYVQGGAGYMMPHQNLHQMQLNGQHGFPGFVSANYGQQQPSQTFDARGFPGMQDPMSFQQHGMQHHPGFQQIGQQTHQGPNSFMQGSTPMSSFFQGVAQNQPQHAAHRQQMMGFHNSPYAMQPHGQSLPMAAYDQFPGPPYATQARPSAPASSNQRPPTSARGTPRPDARQQGSRRSAAVKEFDSSEEDGPLRKRVDHHPSATNDSAIAVKSKRTGQDEESGVEFVSSKPKLGFKGTKEKKILPKQQGPAPSTTKSVGPAPQGSPSSAGSIDWTLPKYEAQFEPGPTKHDPTVAKVSIPGIVREEIFLSPDHAEQETHLLLHIFLPNQERLETPDTNPAVAILNFHTVAVMVIEAFVQFEIGDEYGLGRGHWHNDHDEDGDAEYQRLRDAKDADPDDIFFAVIDRWRAGLESNKQPSKLIRGTQEFCDIALDIIYYIREHGLLKERQRVVRADKGVKRGAKKVGEKEQSEDEDTPMKGAKRGAGKIHEPKVTKKAKVQPKPKTPTKPKPRKSRAKTVGVTVIRKAK